VSYASVSPVMIIVQYTFNCLRLRRVAVFCACALCEGLTEFCFLFRFGFCATMLYFTSWIERLHFCY